ncbi:MAG: transcriptional repressor [Syntrophomonadaceae bacterium]|nr:transcriptional repressor [Syntrophomonadaceae bacterium]
MLDSYCKVLNKNRFKVTRQRKAILEAMEKAHGVHLTADDIYMDVKQNFPEIGISTVYRTLELLARLNIVHKTSFDEGKFRYEFCEDEGHYHHHFVCNGCGSIIEVEEDFLHHLESALEERGFIITDHKVQLYGYCPECRDRHTE